MNRLIKSEKQIELVRESGKIAAQILRRLKNEIVPGVSTRELDVLARELIKEAGGRPAFLGYRPEGARHPYQFAICTSVNDGVVHGIPSAYILKDGDVLKIDLGVDIGGGISDTAVTVPVGKVSKEATLLIKTTSNALGEGIRAAKAGHTLGDLGAAIERTVTANGFKVIRNLTGHGVGVELHEDPAIYNYGQPGSGIVLKEGMILALEPITSLSTGLAKQLDDDSFVTSDGSLSAHFEHTVLIKEGRAEILTA